MNFKTVSGSKALDLLSETKAKNLKNITETKLFLGNAKKGSFVKAAFVKNERVVHYGELNKRLLKKSPKLAYTRVPLGLILEGEIVVLEEEKGVRRLLPGDFVGLFETAFYLHTGKNRRIGKWSLVADTDAEILFFNKSTWKHNAKESSRLKNFVIELAKTDLVPKPVTDLALLDEIAAKTTNSLLENTLIVVHGHLLPTSFALFRHLAHLVGYHNLFILEKPYSTIRPIYNRLVTQGSEVIPVVMVENASYEFALRRSLDVLWDKVISVRKKKPISKIILMDDGGNLILSVPWEKLRGVKIAAVEQTQLGINRLKASGHRRPAVINVAESLVKKDLEATFIGRSVVNKIKSLGLLDRAPQIGIIGTGSIGKSIQEELRNSGLNPFYYDIKMHTEGFSNQKTISSVDTIIDKADLVIGCTGSDFLKGVSLERVKGRKVLVSASSSDIEFLSILNLNSFKGNSFGTIVVKVSANLEFEVVNGGYPVNFDREQEWETRNEIQLTRCLLYLGLMQALNSMGTFREGVIAPLEPAKQNLLLRSRDKENLLVRT